MGPEGRALLEELFHSALNLPPAERGRFLDEARLEEEMRRELDSLLACAAPEQSGFWSPIVKVAGGVAGSDAESWIGRRIDNYELVCLLGQGGMGTVFLAVRVFDQFEKRVALKIVSQGFRTTFALERFRWERQILARFDHPNIARLLDGGTTEEGLPYIVMEYVEGEPINEYCERSQLSVEARLRLFQHVCAAVEHAHQHLVIHRDIKPGNILVTSDGTPKLLDFGIAKLLDPQSTAEATAAVMLTPDYASPEQVRGEPATTLSDIYTLGGVLYTILTGQKPHIIDNPSPAAIASAICDIDPETPSLAAARSTAVHGTRNGCPPAQLKRLQQRLSGDLDSIVLKALRKNPQERYGSVARLSGDIQRHLEGSPVTARRDVFGYRAAKLARKYRWAVAAAVAVLVTLLGGIVATSREAAARAEQAARAERRFNDVRKLAQTFLFDVQEKLSGLSGSTEAREQMLRMGLEYLDRLSQEARDDPTLSLELAQAYHRFCEFQGVPGRSNLGQPKEALKSCHKAVEILESLRKHQPNDPAIHRLLSRVYLNLADLATVRGMASESGVMARKALELVERVAGAGPPEDDDFAVRRQAHSKLGDVLMRNGQPAAALEQFQKARGYAEAMHSRRSDLDSRVGLAWAHHWVGYSLLQTGDLRAAVKPLRDSIRFAEAALKEKPNHPMRHNLVTFYQSLGDLLTNGFSGNLETTAETLEYRRKALGLAHELASADKRDAQARRQLAWCYGKLAYQLRDTSPAESERLFRNAWQIAAELSRSAPEVFDFQRSMAFYTAGIARALGKQHRIREAEQEFRRALEQQHRLSERDPGRKDVRRESMLSRFELGDLLLAAGRYTEGEREYHTALEMAKKLVRESENEAIFHTDAATGAERLAKLHAARGHQPGLASSERERHCLEARRWSAKSSSDWEAAKMRSASVDLASAMRRLSNSVAACSAPAAATEP